MQTHCYKWPHTVIDRNPHAPKLTANVLIISTTIILQVNSLKYFVIFIFVALDDYENIMTKKISRFKVYLLYYGLTLVSKNTFATSLHAITDTYMYM